MKLVVDVARLHKSIQHITAEDIINIVNAFAPLVRMPRTESSTTRGRTGELNISSMIHDFEMEKPGTHSGDLIIWKREFPNIRIMIEIKNYSNPVPRELFNKFCSEVEIGCYSGGIFISNQPIQGVCDYIIGNKAIVTQYDEILINTVCQLLWSKIYERTLAKVINHDNKLISHCNGLVHDIEDLKRIRISLDQFQHNAISTLSKAVQHIDKINCNINESINTVTMDISTITTTYELTAHILLPKDIECSVLNIGRSVIEKFLSSYANNRVLINQKKIIYMNIYLTKEK